MVVLDSEVERHIRPIRSANDKRVIVNELEDAYRQPARGRAGTFAMEPHTEQVDGALRPS